MAGQKQHINTMNMVRTSNRGDLVVRNCSCGNSSEHETLGAAVLAKEQHEKVETKRPPTKPKTFNHKMRGD